MNIKGLTPQLSPLDTRLRTDEVQRYRTHNSSDRDGNGHREEGESEARRHLSDVEFEEALRRLKQNGAVVTHGLTIRVEQLEDCRVIYIEDPNGTMVRRLSEADLWLVTREKDPPKGKILDRAG